MATLRQALVAVWRHRLPTSIAAAVLGIALVALSEFGDVHETRWFGALLISLGGIGLGLDAGIGGPERWTFLRGLLTRRTIIAAVGALALVLPVVIALTAALIGLFADSDHRSRSLLAAGGLTGAFLLLATVVASALAVRAVAKAVRHEPGIGEDQQPVETAR